MNFLNLPDTQASQARTAAVLLPLAYADAIPDAGKAAEAILEASKLLSLWDAETGTDLSSPDRSTTASTPHWASARAAIASVGGWMFAIGRSAKPTEVGG